MKLRGIIQGQEVVVLIDCGASHNFISTELAAKLRIPSVNTYCGVLMGTGLYVKGEGLCKGVVLQLPNIEVKADFLPLRLGSTNVIFGMQWLETLGGMQVNWRNLAMSFKQDGLPVTLQGDPSLRSSLISLKAMFKAFKGEGEAILLELCSLISTDQRPQETVVPVLITQLLQEFANIFVEPKKLPPHRARDHAIVLHPGTSPVNV